jgi:hypothetical protein
MIHISRDIQFHDKPVGLDHWQVAKELVIVFPFSNMSADEGNIHMNKMITTNRIIKWRKPMEAL